MRTGHDDAGHEWSTVERHHQYLRVTRRVAARDEDAAARGLAGARLARGTAESARASRRPGTDGVPKPRGPPVVGFTACVKMGGGEGIRAVG